MERIKIVRQQVEQSAGLAQVLARSLEAFGLLAAACLRGQEGSRELFATYAFASTAATEARIALAAAPSMPAQDSPRTRPPQSVHPDLNDTVTDALADLAQLLHARLCVAGRQAQQAGDQAACNAAAQQAHLIASLLAPGPRP